MTEEQALMPQWWFRFWNNFVTKQEESDTNSEDTELVTAMITPFKEDESIDFTALKKLARHLIYTGSDAILVGGSTGEEPNLDEEEKWDVLACVKKVIRQEKSNTKVWVGTGSSSTRRTIEETKKALANGADVALIVVPPYNKPDKDGLLIHYGSVAKEVPEMPIIMYNIPSRTGILMETDVIAELANKYPNIVGVKQSFGDMNKVTEMIAQTPKNFVVYSGDDSLTLPMLSLGAKGVVSVASHIAGCELKQMIRAFKEGNLHQAQDIHQMLYPLTKALFITSNPVPVKEILSQNGMISSNMVRAPLATMNDTKKKEMAQYLKTYANFKSNQR